LENLKLFGNSNIWAVIGPDIGLLYIGPDLLVQTIFWRHALFAKKNFEFRQIWDKVTKFLQYFKFG